MWAPTNCAARTGWGRAAPVRGPRAVWGAVLWQAENFQRVTEPPRGASRLTDLPACAVPSRARKLTANANINTRVCGCAPACVRPGGLGCGPLGCGPHPALMMAERNTCALGAVQWTVLHTSCRLRARVCVCVCGWVGACGGGQRVFLPAAPHAPAHTQCAKAHTCAHKHTHTSMQTHTHTHTHTQRCQTCSRAARPAAPRRRWSAAP